jgi:hypothetical protein
VNHEIPPVLAELFADPMRFVVRASRSETSLAAEDLFLRKQLAFYRERKIRPRRMDAPTRLALVWLNRSSIGQPH